MATKAAYVWRGGAKLLFGKSYKPGFVFDDEFVMGLQNRDALLSAGTVKIEVVDVAPPKEEEPVASTTTTKSKPKASKPRTKKTAPRKATKPETVKDVEARVAEAEAEDAAVEPEE